MQWVQMHMKIKGIVLTTIKDVAHKFYLKQEIELIELSLLWRWKAFQAVLCTYLMWDNDNIILIQNICIYTKYFC